MNERVAVNFRGRGLQDAGLNTFCKAEHIDRAHDVGLDGLDRIVLVMDRRRGASEIIDLIDLEQDRLGHIVTDELEIVVVQQMRDVLFAAGKEIVETDDLVAFIKKPFAKMRTDKPGPAGDKNSHNT